MKFSLERIKEGAVSSRLISIIQPVTRFIKNRKKTTAVIILMLLSAVYGIYKFNQQADPLAALSNAQAEAVRGSIEVTVSGTGTTTAVASENIGAGVSGMVKAIHVQNGERVKKGDVLMEVDNDLLKLEVEKARVELEKASIDVSSSSLSADTIKAPFAGRIVSLDIKKGDEVSKNAILATLQDDSQLVFDMPVTTAMAQKVNLNQKVDVFLPDRGENVEGWVIAKNDDNSGGNRFYLRVAISATGNLSSGTKAFGTVTIDGQQVDALAVSNLEWKGYTQLKATLAGEVTAVYIREGQSVKQGQNLFAINNNSILSQQKSQQISYQQARYNLTDLEDQINNLTVKAPVDGIVSGMTVQEGDEVGSGTSVGSTAKAAQTAGVSNETASSGSEGFLGKIINTDHMKISFPVDEMEIAKVEVGQVASITVDALPDQVFQGQVTEIAEEGLVTNNVSSFEVTIIVDNPEKLIKSGMTANVTISVSKKTNVVLIPIEALQERGQRRFVLLPSEGDSEPGQNMRPVRVGLTNESFAEIIEGLEPGEKVLLPGVQMRAGGTNTGVPGFGGGVRIPTGGGTRSPMGGGSRGATP